MPSANHVFDWFTFFFTFGTPFISLPISHSVHHHGEISYTTLLVTYYIQLEKLNSCPNVRFQATNVKILVMRFSSLHCTTKLKKFMWGVVKGEMRERNLSFPKTIWPRRKISLPFWKSYLLILIHGKSCE